jgi:hypothetical protein
MMDRRTERIELDLIFPAGGGGCWEGASAAADQEKKMSMT